MIAYTSHFPEKFLPVAYVDVDKDTCAAAAEKYNATVVYYDSLEDALGEQELEAVIITSPARLHGEQIRLCLERGLHVFVAKPMTYDLEEANQLVNLAESKGLCLVVDQQLQFRLTERVLKEWIQTGKYGKLGFVQYTIHRHRPNMGAFTGENPFVWEQGVHIFNSLIAIVGKRIVSVSANEITPPWSNYNGPTICLGLLEFEGGLHCNLFGSFESHSPSAEMRFECEQAALRIYSSPSIRPRLEIALPGKEFDATDVADSGDSSFPERFTLEAFYEGACDGGRVTNDGRDNLSTLAVVDAFIRASRTGNRELVRHF